MRKGPETGTTIYLESQGLRLKTGAPNDVQIQPACPGFLTATKDLSMQINLSVKKEEDSHYTWEL